MKKARISPFFLVLVLAVTMTAVAAFAAVAAAPQQEQSSGAASEVTFSFLGAVPFWQQTTMPGSPVRCGLGELETNSYCPRGTCRSTSDCPPDFCIIGPATCDVNMPIWSPCIGACYCGG